MRYSRGVTKTQAQIGQTVRAAAADAGIRHVVIAGELGIPPASLSNKLLGRRPFTVVELAKVASVLGTTVDAILTGVEPANTR